MLNTTDLEQAYFEFLKKYILKSAQANYNNYWFNDDLRHMRDDLNRLSELYKLYEKNIQKYVQRVQNYSQ